MKKKKFEFGFIALAITILAIVIAIIIANILLQGIADWKKVLLDLLNDILSVAIVGVIATIFTKIISDNFFKIKRNNEKLTSFGIDYIGGGISSKKDTANLFGEKIFPSVIKLMFITGDGFFKTFEENLKYCLDNSNCEIKILLMSVVENNAEYVKRMEYLCPQSTPYAEQIKSKSLKIIQPLKEKYKDRINVRYYRDEYRYNFRIAQYDSADGRNYKCWLNIQPFNKDAVSLSVGLQGGWNDNQENLDTNIFNYLNEGFDLLWNKYEDTENQFEYIPSI